MYGSEKVNMRVRVTIRDFGLDRIRIYVIVLYVILYDN